MNDTRFQQPHIPFEQLSLHPCQQFSTTNDLSRHSFLLLTDSHGRCFPPLLTNPHYSLTTITISGLSWLNTLEQSLSAQSLLFSPSFSSHLPNYSRILFLIGTNSVRSTKAPEIIAQIEHIIDRLRLSYPHLSIPHAIGIISAFPCRKRSGSFTSSLLLKSNIDHYNHLLHELSKKKHFFLLNIPVANIHLKHDGMHLHPTYLSMLRDPIIQYFDENVFHTSSSSSSHHRSQAAITRRHQKRHAKLRLRQFHQTVTRSIAPVWKLAHLKTYLKHKQIIYSRLPEIRRHILSIRFNNPVHQQHAEQVLSEHDFDANSYYYWINHQH